jgi:hypothetical protein
MFHYDTSNVLVAQEMHVDVKSAKAPAASQYTKKINGIGYQFAYFDMKLFKYVLVDSMCYFVKVTNGSIYKMVVTYFKGQADGKIKFDKTQVYNSGIEGPITSAAFMRVIGNPVNNNQVEVVCENKQPLRNASVNLVDINGRLVHSYPVGAMANGLHGFKLDVAPFANGMYLLQLVDGNVAATGVTKVIIAR